MKEPQIKRITRRIICRLFRTSDSQFAKRLVIECKSGHFEGGWSKLGVQRQIEEVLEREP